MQAVSTEGYTRDPHSVAAQLAANQPTDLPDTYADNAALPRAILMGRHLSLATQLSRVLEYILVSMVISLFLWLYCCFHGYILPACLYAACMHGCILPASMVVSCLHPWLYPACMHGYILPACMITSCLHPWLYPACIHGYILPTCIDR